MKRKSVYPYTVKEPPGHNVHMLRNSREWSQRELGDRCSPPLDHTTIRRLERNLGFTQDTLSRVSKALGVQDYELWLPAELAPWISLPPAAKRRVAEYIRIEAQAARHTQET